MKESWKTIAQIYDKILPPGRPSIGDIKIFGQFLSQTVKPHSRLLSLGCTPELRNLFTTLSLTADLEVTLIDQSEDMYKAMSFLIEETNPKETYVHGSWFNTGFPDHTFDFITGDEVIVNVNPKNRNQFFAEIRRVLKPGGYFITRHNAANENNKELDKEEIFRELDKALSLEQTINQTVNSVGEIFIENSAAQRIDQPVSMGDILDSAYAFFGDLSNDPKYSKLAQEFIKRAKLYYEPTRDQSWAYSTEETNESEIKNYFTIIDKAQANDYIHHQYKAIYLLQTK